LRASRFVLLASGTCLTIFHSSVFLIPRINHPNLPLCSNVTQHLVTDDSLSVYEECVRVSMMLEVNAIKIKHRLYVNIF
jgi:hypothetical protein